MGTDPGDLSTAENPEVVDTIREQLHEPNRSL
jgi:hypothetical protein